ncbi:MAG TPA: tripartite tricarboxylate transporter substrate binding protein [Usitatibacter sp.]|jgi:tripartite-type tricarboxylate transporter receptor subunit TctC|nr:tripartite tricarboxylate transporter substrate binding protein [Usitatibacter sp.]
MSFRSFALAAALAATTLTALAEGYPDHAIKLVVPFPAGGPTDIVARPLAQALGAALKQSVLVENRGGAGGSIGADIVAKSPADGYTLLMGTVGTNAINGALYSNLPHDVVKDFTPVALVASSPVVLVVNPQAPYKSVADYVAAARAKPGAVSFGSAGAGTPGHLTGEMFATAAGVKLQHVPYKGSAPAITDLLGNHIPSMFDPLQSQIPHIRSGKLRALAISGTTRSTALPEVPTFAEAGVKGVESRAWWAVFGPANLPPEVTARLRGEIGKIAKSPAFRDLLGAIGVQTNTEGVSLPEFQREEVARWQKAVRDSGAKAD